VLSMRNKVNRLEEIFMALVEGRGADDPQVPAGPAAVRSAAAPAARAGAEARR
jgi:hypothetical protein